MFNEKSMISSKQLIFLFLSLIQASTFTAVFISATTKQDTWLVSLCGFIIVFLLLNIYISLCNKFPGKTIIEIFPELYGKILGTVISFLYIFYFWFILPSNYRFIADFFSTHMGQNSDIIPFIIPTAILCIYTLKKGLEVISRISCIFSILTLLVSLIITILIINEIHFSKLFPAFQLNWGQFIQGTNVIVSIPLGEVVVFLLIFPNLNDKTKLKKSALLGFSLGYMFFLFILIRNILILGGVGSIQIQPTYQIASLINIGDFLNRVEILTAMFLLSNLFLKICFFTYAAVVSIAQCFKLTSYKPLVIPVTIISSILSITMFESPLEESVAALTTYPIFALLFIVIIPIISFIIACVKNSTTLN
ncbi:GerAB/ArcD/ProY family transporter [Clostridium felsineum]|uniref:Uncharacterized protein n=1 Tax=Clostridium felsineum TaxID=36839 RepID=A0A1S8LYW4_9CLOT|nr:endospore germination permease [Clostridium felsineum]URZ09088.1 hypothetical protein CLROS_045040 [Clostridium felsineum]URZ13775.1 hypothetical protein CROST_045530 [Clostridium felsineum]